MSPTDMPKTESTWRRAGIIRNGRRIATDHANAKLTHQLRANQKDNDNEQADD